MAYIPTIHTFEDDVNENRSYEEQPITGGVEKIFSEESILVPEKTESNLGKKILITLSIILILASIGMVGYYFYKQYEAKQAEALLNAQALAAEQNKNNQNTENTNLQDTLPLIYPGISSYINDIQKKNNIIIITIKDNTENNLDNYSLIYSYILAHKKDLGNDLINTFKLNSEASIPSENIENQNNLDDNTKNSSTTLNKVVDVFNPENLQKELGDKLNTIAPQELITAENLIWENKTINNQDFEIANAGIVTLIYGYISNNKYLILTTSVKDFLSAADSLN